MILPKLLCFSLVIMSLTTIQSAIAREGDIAFNFDLPLLKSGERLKLSDYRGSVVLVDFWASWCGPCRASFPAYDSLRIELQEKYGQDKFEILAINVDMTKREAMDFLKKTPVSFPVLDEDTGGKTQQHYQFLAMPTSYLIDPKGVIQVQHAGFSQGYVALIESEVKRLVDSNSE